MTFQDALPFILFTALILALLIFDLGVIQRRTKAYTVREAARWTAIWVALAMLFNVLVYFKYEHQWLGAGQPPLRALSGTEAALQFLTGYLIEESLSVDNIFVFLVIFSYFGVPVRYQPKVLFWGVLGAIVMRFTFILAGTVLINRFEWVLYVFGAILIVTGWRMFTQQETAVHPEKNIFIRLARKLFPVTEGYEPPKFLIRRKGRIHLTPLLIVLITVETTDIVFAVDSIPAVFGVTRDPFIVYTSNMFAILGLRSLYFVLAGAMASFSYLKHGLSVILLFIGVKMLLADIVHIPIAASLAVVGSVLTASIGFSIVRRRRQRLK